MANPSLAALQTALFAALSGSAAIQAHVGNPARVFDFVPQDTAYPFITIGDDTIDRYDSQTRLGIDSRVTFHVFDRSDETTNRRGRLKVKQILDAIFGVLHDQALTVTGNAHVLTLFESGATELLEDGLSYHGAATYRIITQGT